MADPSLTRATRHFVVDQSKSTQAILELHEYIGAHETVMATQASELTVEQSTTIESYAEGLDLTHTARPMYAGAEVDKLIALEDNHDSTWLAVIYDDGSFYLGKASVGTSGEYPTTGFVTQNTDFGQVEPWIGHFDGSRRHTGALASATTKTFRAVKKQFDKAPTHCYVLVANGTGIASGGKVKILDGSTDLTDESADISADGGGLYPVALKSNQDLANADGFQVSAAITGGTAELYILMGSELV